MHRFQRLAAVVFGATLLFSAPQSASASIIYNFSVSPSALITEGGSTTLLLYIAPSPDPGAFAELFAGAVATLYSGNGASESFIVPTQIVNGNTAVFSATFMYPTAGDFTPNFTFSAYFDELFQVGRSVVQVFETATVSGSTDLLVVAPVPEPSTWAMLLIGFAGIGFAAHRKRSARFRSLAYGVPQYAF